MKLGSLCGKVVMKLLVIVFSPIVTLYNFDGFTELSLRNFSEFKIFCNPKSFGSMFSLIVHAILFPKL